MQLDIFEHTHDVMLRNDAIAALERRDAAAARGACERFAGEYPKDPSATALRALADGLARADAPEPLQDRPSLGRARQAIEALQPAAQAVFGPAVGERWLAPMWRQLARRAAAVPFASDCPQDHAAALWQRAGDWEAVARAAAAIESWRRIPAPLAWMAEARLRLLGLPAAWPLLAELGWLSPARLAELLRRSPDPLLSALARRFDASFEGTGEADDAAWFAAWVLTERPDLAAGLAAAQPARHGDPERAFRVLVELIGLERQGRQRDVVARRKTLRDLHAGLYAAYLRDR